MTLPAISLLWSATALALALGPTVPPAEAPVELVPASPADAPSSTPAADPLAGPRGLDPDRLVAGEEAAYRAFMRGKQAFESDDLDAAVLAFSDALRQLPDEPPYARSRGALALWAARCQGRIYELRGESSALDREESLLRAYAERIGSIATDDADRQAKQALVDQRLGQITDERARIVADHGAADEQLDRSLRGEYGGVDTTSWAPGVEDLAWVPRPDDPRPRGQQDHDEEQARQQAAAAEHGRARKPGTGMIAGGAVALGVGIAALAVMGAGMARAYGAESFPADQDPQARRDQIERGMSGNAMAIAGAITGGVAVVTGAVLLGLGVKKRRRATATVAPQASRRGAGLSLTVRFAP